LRQARRRFRPSRDERTVTAAGRIVVGVDGSEPAARALAFALNEGRLRDWEVEAVHAWTFPAGGHSPSDPIPGADVLDRVLAAADTSGVQVTPRLVLEASLTLRPPV
jgi:nucleotide-binding universal stress UspA family protein